MASPAPRTAARALRLAQGLFARRNIDSPALSAQLLLADVLGLSRMELLLDRTRLLAPAQWRAFWRLASRRSLGEPAAYILGRKEFYGRDFCVGPDVLTPRPETEHLVEAITARFDSSSPLRFADLGTGSGCIAVTLALELPQSRGLALDICPQALNLARENARRLDADAQLLFLQGDFAAAPLRCGALDLLVANPPYVAAAQYTGLSREVTAFEPQQALVPLQDAGSSGLESIALVLQAGAQALRPGGLLVLEHGCTQGPALLELAACGPWRDACVLPDLAGLDRSFLAWRS